MLISAVVEISTMASLLVISGSRVMPMEKTRQPQKASRTMAAPSGMARCWKHHSRLLPYLSCTFSNQASFLGAAFFSTVEDAAGTTVMATMREAMRQ